jgi:hypothetical protein
VTSERPDPYVSSLGRSYVPITEQTGIGPLAVLDEASAATLAAVVDRLIPGDKHWPVASSTGAVRHIDGVLARVPELRPEMLRLLDAVESAAADGFAAAEPDRRDAILRAVEADPAHAGTFRAIYEMTCEAYYRHESVLPVMQERTGYDTTLPLRGVPLGPFDESRLDRVRSLPPRYRKVRS